jgi:hypothetical protein
MGRGYLGRLLVAAPYQEEQARRIEMERQRRLQEERERLAAAAERCRMRMLEVQRKLLEAAWDRIRVCMTDEQTRRAKHELDAQKEFDGIVKLKQRDLLRREEIDARKKDVEIAERQLRATEDQEAKLERQKPNLVDRRMQQYILGTPCPPPLAVLKPSSPWEASAGRDPNDPVEVVKREEQYHRHVIERQHREQGLELLHWALHSRLLLARAHQLYRTSLLAQLKRNAQGGEYDDETIKAKHALQLDYAATRIQSAWRANSARFERRYRTLRQQRQRQWLYGHYVGEDRSLHLPEKLMKRPVAEKIRL